MIAKSKGKGSRILSYAEPATLFQTNKTMCQEQLRFFNYPFHLYLDFLMVQTIETSSHPDYSIPPPSSSEKRQGQRTKSAKLKSVLPWPSAATRWSSDKVCWAREKEIPILPWFQMQLPLQLMVGFWSSARGRRQGGRGPMRGARHL